VTTPSADTRLAAYRSFTDEVRRLCAQDPGARSALRTGLRRSVDDPRLRPMHRLVAPLLPEDDDRESTMQAYYTVAALIAAQPRHSFRAENQTEDEDREGGEQSGKGGKKAQQPKTSEVPESLGGSLAQAATAKGASMRLSAAESRVNLLARQSLRGIQLHLPATVNQLHGTDALIDWARLLSDLVDWQRYSGRITRRWLQDFYRGTAQQKQL
jgi:CRISPR system Cascade subunit CasB